MKKNVYNEMEDDLRPEYDLSKLKGGVRGKYAQRYKSGTNLVLLDSDVAEVFKDNESVNEALRLLIKIAETEYKKATHLSTWVYFNGGKSIGYNKYVQDIKHQQKSFLIGNSIANTINYYL